MTTITVGVGVGVGIGAHLCMRHKASAVILRVILTRGAQGGVRSEGQRLQDTATVRARGGQEVRSCQE